jgi:hypothetical protein
MTSFYASILLLALIVATALGVVVWRLAKAGGRVKVGFIVKVDWGGK